MNDGPADLTSLRAVVNHRHVVEILSAHGMRYLAAAARDGSAQQGARAGSVRQGPTSLAGIAGTRVAGVSRRRHLVRTSRPHPARRADHVAGTSSQDKTAPRNGGRAGGKCPGTVCWHYIAPDDIA